MSQVSMSKMKIIDMTGRESKVHHGYENLSQISKTGIPTEKQSTFDLPELVKNLDILVNMTEEKIIQSEKKIKHFDDMVITLDYEESKHRQRIIEERDQIDKIENILEVIQKCETLLEANQADLRQIMNIFIQLKSEYEDEFLIFNLSQLAIPLFTPILKQRLTKWRPFDDVVTTVDDVVTDPLFCFDIYADIKDLFKVYNYYQHFGK